MLAAEKKASYNYLDKDDQNKEMLVTDEAFVNDARQFLTKREGYSKEDLASNDDVYDAYMEHFRYQDVNEVTAIRDLQYAQNANQDEKDRFARLTMLYDTKANEGFFDAAGDYFQGVASAPSTYLGVISGGAGKIATIAGLKAAKLALNKILMGGVKKSIVRGALVEGTIGAGQGLAQEMTKVETGYKDEISGANVALTGGISAITGGAISGTAGLLQSKQAVGALEKVDVSQKAAEKVAKSANLKAKKVLEKATEKQKKFISSKLKELDPKKVAMGDALVDDISKAKELGTLKAGLPVELFENISAAALTLQADLSKKGLTFKKGDRITTVLQKAIEEKTITTKQVSNILKEYNLTADQFSLIYKAEISQAGKILNVQSRLVKAIEGLDEAGFSTMTGREARELSKNVVGGSKNVTKQLLKDIDRVRLGFMTSQPATTMRNNFGGGFRVAVEMATRTVDTILNQKVFGGTRKATDLLLFSDVREVGKYVLNPYEAKVTRILLEKSMPDTARKLFRDAADLASTTGGESNLAKLGTKVNFLNTASDNFFKQVMFSSSLKRRLKADGKDLDEMISKGEFNFIKKDIINKSIDDALEFTYQSAFYSKDAGYLAKGTQKFLEVHREVPLTVSAFIPFPRFIANQIKFIYNHAPIIGLLGLENIGKKSGYAKNTFKLLARDDKGKLLKQGITDTANPILDASASKKLAQQATGAGMLYVAYKWREKQGEGAMWNEIKDDQGNYINALPMYGPFAAFMLAADIMYRYYNSDVGGEEDIRDIVQTDTQYWRNALQSAAGSQFRTGYGLYAIDKLWGDLTGEGDFTGSKGARIGGEFLGNIVNTFMIPVSVLKDLYTPFDKESRKVAETRGGKVDFWSVVAQRGFRALPDVGPNTALGRFVGAEEYDTPLSDPFVSGDVQAVDPIEKQLFGFIKRPAKNSLQAEMAKLNLETYDVYKRNTNQLIDANIRSVLSTPGGNYNLNEKLKPLLTEPEYTDLKTQQAKRNYIIDKAKIYIQGAKTQVEKELNQFASDNKLPYSEVHLSKWESATGKLQKEIDLEYSTDIRQGKLEFADGGSDKSKDIFSDKNRMLLLPDGTTMNVLQYASQVLTLKKSQ
tara:strand:+ start:584 stop:3904 length:3321 start_codon:yes stop_codon:yes gene_type:complete